MKAVICNALVAFVAIFVATLIPGAVEVPAAAAYLLPKLSLEPDELTLGGYDLPPVEPADVPAILHARVLDESRRFPLVVSPAAASISIAQATEWIGSHREVVTKWLDDYGAVLLRGFKVTEAQEFQDVAAAFSDRLHDVYLGTSPRKPVKGSKYVFTASEFEAWKVVPPHSEVRRHRARTPPPCPFESLGVLQEKPRPTTRPCPAQMSFLPSPPEHIFFFAAEMPEGMVGGETPLVDLRAVARTRSGSCTDGAEARRCRAGPARRGARGTFAYLLPTLARRFRRPPQVRWAPMRRRPSQARASVTSGTTRRRHRVTLSTTTTSSRRRATRTCSSTSRARRPTRRPSSLNVRSSTRLPHPHFRSPLPYAPPPYVTGKRQGFEPSWGPRGILKLTHEMPAFRLHPSTGEPIWHNHLGVLHSAAWADEFAFAAAHLRSVHRSPLQSMPLSLLAVAAVRKRSTGDAHMRTSRRAYAHAHE